jgi:hypothetical protein
LTVICSLSVIEAVSGALLKLFCQFLVTQNQHITLYSMLQYVFVDGSSDSTRAADKRHALAVVSNRRLVGMDSYGEVGK